MAYWVDEKTRHRPFWIQSKPSNEAYREGYERTFGKQVGTGKALEHDDEQVENPALMGELAGETTPPTKE